MSGIVKIAIIDTDLYFIEGLKQALSAYFTLKGKAVEFSLESTAADLVFFSQHGPGNIACCDMTTCEADFPSFYISIQEGKKSHILLEKKCVRTIGVLDRHANVDMLFNLLEEALWRMIPASYMPKPCIFCLGTRLSGREKEVMSYLRLGVNQTQAAKYMHLSVKTVHTYKQSVMRKLNFRKRNDLFNWLLKE